MDATLRKQNGVHYTPPELADFLARRTADCLAAKIREVSILDPACGDGQLLASLIECLRVRNVDSIRVVAFDTDPVAIERTQSRLASFDLSSVQFFNEDFLASARLATANLLNRFDCVIANPPYVRTQVLGANVARALAQKYKLHGRVDLYQAFAVAVGEVLKPGGSLGLLTSNRFLSVKSGAAMRRLLKQKFELSQIFDLGDTRLFEAAVLPAVVVGVRRDPSCDLEPAIDNQRARYHRIYRVEGPLETDNASGSILAAIEDSDVSGEVETATGRYLIQRGELSAGHDDAAWTLVNSTTRRWLKQVRSRQVFRFGDLVDIKVGIKTTADSIFIRRDWTELKQSCRPEDSLLGPLITHHDARKWSIQSAQKSVLYPYDLNTQKRTPVELARFPKTECYLQQHRERLESRKYVIDSGRSWFEIWVPHQPADWAKPKIVWPDISKQPKFFFDSSGSVVNGDCYWAKLRPDVDPEWLFMMLAVANSSVVTKFYDTMFHNKLYAGRRRFMTQYVKEFPLPALDSKLGKQIVSLVKRLIESPNESDQAKVESKVRQAFGL